jgi:hypothetical protein
LSFFDDDGDEPHTATRTARPSPRRPAGRGRRSLDDRTLLIRRAGAALVVVLIVVVVVLVVKTVLDRQASDALKTYVTNVNAIVDSEQSNVRLQFFGQLDLAYNSSNQIAVANDLQQEVQAVQADYRTAQGWSVPSQMLAAQRGFVSVLGFRAQAMAAIENEIPQALGTGDQTRAITLIAGDMEMLLTADVIFAERVQPLIQQALGNAGITGQLASPSAFLPDSGWVIPQTAANRILGYVPVALGGAPPRGSNGHELLGVTYNNGVVLSTSAPNTIAVHPEGVTFVLSVRNSGTGRVHDVITKVLFSARSASRTCLHELDKTSSVPLTVPGQSYQSAIVVIPSSSCTSLYRVPLDMTAEVVPVPGETDAKNNRERATVELVPGQ